jgi:hypothetical protein
VSEPISGFGCERRLEHGRPRLVRVGRGGGIGGPHPQAPVLATTATLLAIIASEAARGVSKPAAASAIATAL